MHLLKTLIAKSSNSGGAKTPEILVGMACLLLVACQSTPGDKSVSVSTYSPKLSYVSQTASVRSKTTGFSSGTYAAAKPVRKASYTPIQLASNQNTRPEKLYLGSANYICSASGFGSRASCRAR
ncbi:hypothetical protein [Cohaesibacter haloalkalitolerans]|uniref:hypothetical protein n=1 Tax=Cohaesibacter haloalkalitolerans TaxID=1162980 RepID=UPI0013C46E6F|nr:hypothetical protein [Cohaesibacter haloalkalitolerans]